MGEIVNLRRARKARRRAEDEATADANRIAFGRTKADRAAMARQAETEARRLDRHRREQPAGSDD